VRASWALSLFGCLFLFTQAVTLLTIREPLLGLSYLAVLGLLGFFLKRSFDRGLFRHGDHLDPRLVPGSGGLSQAWKLTARGRTW
jgi:hypothetical protein